MILASDRVPVQHKRPANFEHHIKMRKIEVTRVEIILRPKFVWEALGSPCQNSIQRLGTDLGLS